MNTHLQYRMIIRQVLLVSLLVFCFCIGKPGMTWPETADSPPGRGQGTVQEEERTIRLEDGSIIELTGTGVVRRQADAGGETVLWSVEAKEPQLPLIFENREGLPLLLYFVQKKERYGEFHAVRVEDGQTQWTHPVWMHKFLPVSPIWVKPWIYFGQGIWLEKMNPEDGKIMERYPARAPIESLQVLQDGEIEVYANGYEAEIRVHFRDGQFSPHIMAPGNLLASLGLYKRAELMMEDFGHYLQLHRIDREPLSPEFIIQWRDFDLQEAEETYRRAYQEDPTNPYLSMYVGLSLYYQERKAEAETYFQTALDNTANVWEDSLRLGSKLCEGYGLHQWADAFYEQGAAQYFREVPAPPEDVTLIEILIHFMGQRVTARGSDLERALHVLEFRRQLFPYTEWDTGFSQKYVHWLRRMGQEEKAASEEQRLQHALFLGESQGLTPTSFLGFMMSFLLVAGVIILKNEIRHWHEVFLVIPTIAVLVETMLPSLFYLLRQLLVVTGPTTIPLSSLHSGRRNLALIVTILVYVGIMAFVRQRRMVRNTSKPPPALWRMMLAVAASSYLTLLAAIWTMYSLGYQIIGSPSGGKLVEILGIFVLTGVYYKARQRGGGVPISFRNFKAFLCCCLVLWGYFAWLHYYLEVQSLPLPLPSIDSGHPDRVTLIDNTVDEALVHTHEILFIQALTHHLYGDLDFAREAYTMMNNDPRALNNLGVILLEKNPGVATEYFEKALQYQPDLAQATYNLGVMLAKPALIEQARALAPWPVTVYQKYAPDKPWIAAPTIRKESKAIYWSQGGFLVRGFVEIPFCLYSIGSQSL